MAIFTIIPIAIKAKVKVTDLAKNRFIQQNYTNNFMKILHLVAHFTDIIKDHNMVIATILAIIQQHV